MRQVNAKKHGFGAITVMVLMVLAAFSSILFIMNPEQVKAAATDYGYSKELTIAHSYINATLTNFPILVHDSTGDLLGNVLADGSDIAFYKLGNSTQYNHEIDEYNSTSGELWAWVNITSYSHTVDTVFYMYYDDSDGGYGVGHNPTSVWDTNFTGVYHMNASTTKTCGCYDSTAGANHGTFMGNMPTNVDGLISGGQYGADDPDYITLPSGAHVVQDISIEIWYKSAALGDNKQVIFNQWDGGDSVILSASGTNTHQFAVSDDGTPTVNIEGGTRTLFWQHWGASAQLTNNASLFINASLIDNDLAYSLEVVPYGNITLGLQGAAGHLFGTIDEVRISNTARTGNWLIASFHSAAQTSGFLTFGAEQVQGDVSSYSAKGLYDSQITFSGTAGITVWCNDTGDHYEWLEVNMSINASQNITDIWVWVGDLNNTGSSEWINASNITLYISADNSSYGSLGAFTDGGNNITVNKTTWPSGAGNDPFDGAGLIDNDTSIYCIFKTTIPATVPTADFWASSGTAYKIHLGRYT